MTTPSVTAPSPRPATPAERAQMDAARAEVRRVYAAARIKVEALNARPFLSVAERSVVANVRKLGDTIEDWATRMGRWAEAGRRDDGSAYDVARWLALGRSHAKDAGDQVGIAWDATPFAVVAGTVAATAGTVATVVNPFAWPTWVKWSVGAGLVVVGLVVARPYIKGAGAILSAVRP